MQAKLSGIPLWLVLGTIIVVVPFVASQALSSDLINNEDRSQLEWLNDGPTSLAVIAPLKVYSGGVACGILSFRPKRTWNWRLIIAPAEFFHIPDTEGEPITLTNIIDAGHHTTVSGWLCATFDGSRARLSKGETTFLVANDTLPPHRVYIDARDLTQPAGTETLLGRQSP